MLAFAPAMGVVTLAFGGWYTIAAIGWLAPLGGSLP
jgi:hypothetical protein